MKSRLKETVRVVGTNDLTYLTNTKKEKDLEKEFIHIRRLTDYQSTVV